jgi:5-methylcytosine-specific restriction endonuclease McrA
MSRYHHQARSTTQRDRDRAAIRKTNASCGICGEPIDYTLPHTNPRSFVVDHIVPLSKGGPDTRSNKQAAHRDCNSTKRARLIAPTIRRSGALN